MSNVGLPPFSSLPPKTPEGKDKELASTKDAGAPSVDILSDNEQSMIISNTLTPTNASNHNIVKFIQSFVRCKSIQQASEEAGINPRVGYDYRHRRDVALCIQKIFDKAVIRYGFDAAELVERVREVTDFDPIMMQNPDGTFKSSLHEMEPAARRNIKSMKVKNLYNQVQDMNGMKQKIIIGQLIDYEFYDKLKAAEILGPEKELFKKSVKVEHTVTKDMASILLGSKKLAEAREIEMRDIEVVSCKNEKVEGGSLGNERT
jgi:hypothetical protein